MPTFRVFRFAVLAALVAGVSLPGNAQRTRIGAINSSSLSFISGNVSPRLAAAKDLGLAPAAQPIQRMSLRFSLTAAQQASLTQLLANLQDPSSPQYHQWLTPEQFGAQFGLAPADLAQVSQWLTAQGFTITAVGRGSEFIQFSGTVGQANQAFHTQLHSVQLGTEAHLANYSAPMLPQAIANVTAAVTGLTDFKLKPHVKSRVIPGDASPGVKPQYTSSLSGSTYMAPGDFYTIYDENAALLSGINGTGIKIVVVGQSDVFSADIANFRNASGLAANAYTVVLDGADPGFSNNVNDTVESELDLEWVGATAPAANIIFVNSINVIDGSLTYAVDQNLAPIISISYGDCEPDLGQADLVFYQTTLQMAAAEGITIVAASGDAGSTDCDAGLATDGVAVDFPSDSPYVTGVGGTEFNEGTGTYWSSTNGTFQGSALSYIPEMAWNDSVAGLISGNGLAAGGGGASGYFSKPSWQVGTGVPNDFSRDTPDVSLNASPVHDPYIMCYTGYCVSGYRASNSALFVVGGTSVGAPSFAGLLALVEQKNLGARIGVANPTIYALANSVLYGSHVFHDVTVGNNASPCSVGTANCLATASPSGFYSSMPCVSTTTNCVNNVLLAYSATAGYDLATGWGSVDAFNMITDWALVTALPSTGSSTPTYTSLTGSAASTIQGSSVTMTATVISGSTTITSTPTGNVQFEIDGVATGSAVALSSGGVATYSLSTTALTTGVHTVQATYLGSTIYAGSKAAFSLNVTSATQPDFTLLPGTTSVTVTHGLAAPGVVFTVAALNGFTGPVTFAASASSSLAAEYSFSVNPVTLSSTTTSAQTTLNLFAYYPAAGISPAQSGLRVKAANESRPRSTIALEAGLSLVGVLLLLLLPRRRKLAGVVIAVLIMATIGISGCTSGTTTNTGAPTVLPTPTGSYTVTISATGLVNSVPVTHTSAVTFIVQ